MSDVEVTILVALVMVAGLAGTVVPFLPGLLLIWAAAGVYGLTVGFGPVGVTVMLLLTLTLAAGAVKSVVVPKRMVAVHGVSRWSHAVAFIGAVVGFVFIPVVGIVIGAMVGLLVAEYAHRRDPHDAWRASMAVARGFGLSALIDVALAMFMIGLWSIWALDVVV